MNAVDALRVELFEARPGEPTHIRVDDHRLARFAVVLDGQKVLLVDLQVLHHEHTVAHQAVLVGPRQHQVLPKHLIRYLLHLVNRIHHVNPRLEPILTEYTLGPRKALHLCLDDELPFEVRAKLPGDDEGFFRCEGHGAEWDRDHVLVHELGGLVLMEQ